jgi:hypothetical protein
MNGFITTNRFNRVFDLPMAFAQTEVRSGKQMVVCRYELGLNQRLVIRSLTCSLIAVLTPGVTPAYLNSALGSCSVGIYRASSVNYPPITSPLAFAGVTESSCTVNPFAPCVIETPGIYAVVVSNNTSNIDLAIAASGAAKFYY